MTLVASSAIIFFNLYKHDSPLNALFWVGTILALSALIFETMADLQLSKFLESKRLGLTSAEFMTVGLWRLSRHPNYFGEVSFWWSIFIIACSVLIYNFSITNLLLILLSPVTITFLILKVSGIPMLEKKNEGNPQWEAYKKVTPAFFPKILK